MKRGIVLQEIEQIISSNSITQLLFLVFVTCFACVKVTIQGRCCRKYIRNTQDSVLYNMMFFASVALAISIVLPLAVPDFTTLWMSGLYSTTNASFQVLYTVALASGPVSLTVLIVNFSVLFPTTLSILFLGDRFFFTQMIGIVCLVVSMILSCNRTEGEQKANKKWLIVTIVCLLVNGVGGCVQKLFYQTETAKTVANSDNTFLVFTYLFSAILALVVYLVGAHTGKKEKSTYWFSKNVLFYALAVGAVIAVFQKMFMMGNKLIPGSIMFPTYYGLQSLGMSLIGIVLFKDKLTARQKIGVLFGIASIALMNVKIGFSVAL